TGTSLPQFSERRAHGIFFGGGVFTALLLIAALIEAPNGSYLFSWPLGALSAALLFSGRIARVGRPVFLLGALALLVPTFAILVQLFSVHGSFPATLGSASVFLLAPTLLPLLYLLCRQRAARRIFEISLLAGPLLLVTSAVLRLKGL
ncbi:MAG: hypothetical protein AAF368_14665, partial [Planctomycetota bacterium]